MMLQGLLQLKRRDYLSLRDAKEDVLDITVTGRCVTPRVVLMRPTDFRQLGREHHRSRAQIVKNFGIARQMMLGPRKTRTASSTAFERTPCTHKIQKKRCYPAGSEMQLSRRVITTSTPLAQKRENIRVHQTIVKILWM